MALLEAGVSPTGTDNEGNTPIHLCESTERGGNFCVGDEVEVLCGPIYYPGRISHVNRDGSYNVDCNNGDQERERPGQIRIRDPEQRYQHHATKEQLAAMEADNVAVVAEMLEALINAGGNVNAVNQVRRADGRV